MMLATIFHRIPKFVLFGAAGLIQVALIGLMVVDRVMILRTGVDVALQTRPLDPRDFLRGDYVVLGYDISTVPAGALEAERPAGRGSPVFVKLAPNRDGFYEAISVHATPVDVASPEVLIRGHVVSGVNYGRVRFPLPSVLQARYGLGSIFVPEGGDTKRCSSRAQL